MAEFQIKAPKGVSGSGIDASSVAKDLYPDAETPSLTRSSVSSYEGGQSSTLPVVNVANAIKRSAARFNDLAADAVKGTHLEELRWVPLELIPADMRELVRVARTHAILLCNGRLPAHGFKTVCGWKSGNLQKSPLRDFLADGTIRDSQRNPPHKFWPDLRHKLFMVGIGENGERIRVDEPVWLMDLIQPIIEKQEGWLPIEQVPEHVRELVRVARQRAIELYGGRVPQQRVKTIDGWCSRNLQFNSIRHFLVNGTIGNTPHKFWPDLRKIIFGIDINEYGERMQAEEPVWLMDLIQPTIEKEEGWLPIDQVPKEVRHVVRVVRDRAISLFDGRLPLLGVEADDWKSGCLNRSPFKRLLQDGTIKYSNRKNPSKYWRECLELFFGLKRLSDGSYRRVEISREDENLIARMQMQGERAWRDGMGNGMGLVVYHPGTSPALRIQMGRTVTPASFVGTPTGVDGTFASCDPLHDPLMFGALGGSTPMNGAFSIMGMSPLIWPTICR